MMRSVIQGGTATDINQYTSGRIVAGKTGTTNDYKDILFVGYTPDITMGVWVGYDKNNYYGSVSGNRAKTIWGKIFSEVVNSQPSISPAGRGFSQPGGIVTRTIDKSNGYLATPDSKSKVNEYFNSKNTPTKYSPKPEEKDKPDQKDNKPIPTQPDNPQDKPDDGQAPPDNSTPAGRTNPGQEDEEE
jgi:penicillin-binding protein